MTANCEARCDAHWCPWCGPGRVTEEQIEKAEAARGKFTRYIDSMWAASEKMESTKKLKLVYILTSGRSWLDYNPKAAAEDINKKHKETQKICAPILIKYHAVPPPPQRACP